MRRFENKRVLLTGAASGIGRATAIRLAEEGAILVGIDCHGAGLAETVNLLPEGSQMTTIVADLSVDQEVVRAAQEGVVALGGEVDVLVNNAGFIFATPMTSATADDFRKLMDVNLLAAVTMCAQVLPKMCDATSAIVNITSTSATKAHPWLSAYAASKGALLSFSYSLSAELAKRCIRVVAISPGGVLTPLVEANPFATEEPNTDVDPAWYIRAYPLWGELGEPEQIAALIAFAASADGGYVNGVELRADGGSHV